MVEKEFGKKANFSVNNKISRINEPREHYVSIQKFENFFQVPPYESNLESRLSQYIRYFDL
jgi:hypothetical protein